MHLNERNEILAIYENHILLQDGAIAIIGKIKKATILNSKEEEISKVTLHLNYNNLKHDTFTFENDILSSYHLIEQLAPSYIRDQIYSKLSPEKKISLSIFMEEIIKLYVIYEMGFMDM